MLRLNGFPPWLEQHRFHPVREWLFDFAWPSRPGEFGPRGAGVALEVEGLTGEGGRHQKPEGFVEDCDKYLAATVLGWTVIRAPSRWIAKPDRRIWHAPLVAALWQFIDPCGLNPKGLEFRRSLAKEGGNE